MRNKFFKFNENYAKVIKHLDDRQAGQYVRAISDYAFKGKTADGRSLTAFVGKDVWEKAKAQMKK